MSELNLNRDRRDLLGAIRNGKVYRSLGGCTMRMARTGQNQRVDRRVRELVDAGWVELAGDGRTYELTDKAPRAVAGSGEPDGGQP